ncbi:MAG: DUF4239 domain-containing protein [Pseudolabrys sp.]|nr:DUF4239 domain-containing protein [Pseudolabrys sp.]
MHEAVISLLVGAALIGASLGSAALYRALPEKHRQAETEEIVRLIANIFVVLASLVLGLMINSARSTFDGVDKAVHAYATELILLDRTLKQYGPETADARRHLQAYAQQASRQMAQSDPVLGSRTAETLLNDIGNAVRALRPPDADRIDLKARSEQRFEKVYEMRWALVEQSEGTIPLPLIALTAAWLVLVFASYGYRAPRNPITSISFVVSAVLIAGTVYLTLDMDIPFDGIIQVSPMPLERALAEMQK